MPLAFAGAEKSEAPLSDSAATNNHLVKNNQTKTSKNISSNKNSLMASSFSLTARWNRSLDVPFFNLVLATSQI